MKVLVTGADGFVGSHLVQQLLLKNHIVFAGLLGENQSFRFPIKINYFNLKDPLSVDNLIRLTKPDGIIHLAAQSMVKVAWDDPAETIAVNTVGTINLVKAVQKYSPESKVVIIGSGEEYGLTGKKRLPLKEDDPCLPQNPYAVSKLAMGQIAMQLAKHYQLRIFHVRPFNHFGPGQRKGFVVSDFSSQIASIESGLAPPIIKVGNLTAQRDFIHVLDVVEAYLKILETEISPGIYNICSGIPHTAQEILDVLLNYARLPISIESDPEKFRPIDVPIYIGSMEKLQTATGWKPRRDFYHSLVETLDWWRECI